MRNSKEFFLSTLGVNIEPELSQFHIVFKRPNEFKPFGELVTTKDGKTVLLFRRKIRNALAASAK